MKARARIAVETAGAPMPGIRSIWPAGHVVHMNLDHTDRGQSVSHAVCDCGWEFRIAWPGHHQLQDQAIELHWQRVENLPTQLGLQL